MNLSPEDEAKLAEYVARIESGDPKRAKIAEMLAKPMTQEQMNEDLAPIREDLQYGLNKMDQVTGAPTRRALSELMAGDQPGAVSRVVQQFGQDNKTAPTWEDLSDQAGIENDYVRKGIGLAGPFLEPNLPFGAAAGMAKKAKRGAKIIDFSKALKESGNLQKELSPIDNLHGDTGKILGNSEDYLPKSQSDIIQRSEDRLIDDGRQKIQKIKNDAIMRQQQAKQKTSMRDKYLAIFGEDETGPIAKAMARVEKANTTPYATLSESGLKSQAIPVPNFKFEAGNEIGKRQISHSVSNNTDTMDPLPWMDSKYEITKNALKNAKGPVRINTSSDLIGHNDYIESIPKGSSVYLYGLSGHGQLDRLLFPGNPSHLRLEKAYEKLKEAGIDVKLVKPTVDEYLSRAEAAQFTKSKGPKFGNLGSNKASTHIEQVTGQTVDELKEQLRDVLPSFRPQAVNGGKVDIDPFGQKAKSKLKRPKKTTEQDDE